jgi:hypothetical protein
MTILPHEGVILRATICLRGDAGALRGSQAGRKKPTLCPTFVREVQ